MLSCRELLGGGELGAEPGGAVPASPDGSTVGPCPGHPVVRWPAARCTQEHGSKRRATAFQSAEPGSGSQCRPRAGWGRLLFRIAVAGRSGAWLANGRRPERTLTTQQSEGDPLLPSAKPDETSKGDQRCVVEMAVGEALLDPRTSARAASRAWRPGSRGRFSPGLRAEHGTDMVVRQGTPDGKRLR